MYKSHAQWKMLWGMYSAIYGEVNVSVEKCVEIKGDCWKIAKLFYFCHLKKLVRPETFGPYYVLPLNFQAHLLSYTVSYPRRQQPPAWKIIYWLREAYNYRYKCHVTALMLLLLVNQGIYRVQIVTFPFTPYCPYHKFIPSPRTFKKKRVLLK